MQMSKTLENINSMSLSSILLWLKSGGCGTWSGSYDLPNQTRIWRLWFSFLGEEPKIFQWEKIHIVTWQEKAIAALDEEIWNLKFSPPDMRIHD
jgi:hypothetical protein